MTRMLVLPLSVVLIVRDKDCAPCWHTHQIRPVSQTSEDSPQKRCGWLSDGRNFSPPGTLYPSILTFCQKKKFPSRTGSGVCLPTRSMTHSGLGLLPARSSHVFPSGWGLTVPGHVFTHPLRQEMGTMHPGGQEGCLKTMGWHENGLDMGGPSQELWTGNLWGTPGETSVPYKGELKQLLLTFASPAVTCVRNELNYSLNRVQLKMCSVPLKR